MSQVENLVQQGNPERYEQIRRELILEGVVVMLTQKDDFDVAADFDQNISRGGQSKGLDPRDSYIDPIARQAFVDMHEAGKDGAIISSRGARDVARIIDVPGISIIGTLGWETFVADENDPTRGVSHIHPRFRPYQTQITGILGDIRQRFFVEQLGMAPEVEDEPNVELPTPDGGVIILQRKGFNGEYPEGINLTWALNLVHPDARDQYKEALARYYQEAYDLHTQGLDEAGKAKLKELSGLMIRAGTTNEGLPTLDVEIRPVSQGAKAIAMLQLMREPGDPKRLESFQHMPYHATWIYSGDHAQQDGPVMRAGHTAYSLSNGKRGVIGVWAKPQHEGYHNVRGADVVVTGVTGNAELLRDIATLVTQYHE